MRRKGLKFLLARIWAIWLLIHFLLFFLAAYPLFRFFLAREPRYPRAHALRKAWGRYILFMCGIRLLPEFEFIPEKGKTYILAPNHSSYLDIPAVTVMMPLYFNFMAKDELRRVPLFGIFFSTIDIAVFRQSAIASHKAFLNAAERLKEGTSLCLFPEGTINEHAPKLGRFKEGAFRLAIENKVEIIPVTLPDNHRRLAEKPFRCTPGNMRMFVHRPVATAHLKAEDAGRLKQEVFSIIEEKLKQYESYG